MHAKRLSAAFLLIGAVLWGGVRPAGAVAFTARYGHTSTLTPDGNIVVIGGQSNDTPTLISGADAIQISLEGQATFINGANTNFVARTSHTATLLPNGQILVAGGVGAGNTVLQSVQVYNPSGNCWTTAVNMLTAARVHHTATLLRNGKVLICGGQNTNTPTLQSHFNATCDLYTPPTTPMTCGAATGGSAASVTMLTQRAQHTATLLSDGRVFLAGGRNFTASNVPQYLLTTEVYNPGPSATPVAPPNGMGAARSLLERRANHRATLLGNGKVLIAGGINDRNFQENRGYLSTVELYDPVADSMTPAAPMNQRRSEHVQILQDDGEIVTYGGLGNLTTNFMSISGEVEAGSTISLCYANNNPVAGCASEVPTIPVPTLSTGTIRRTASNLQIHIEKFLSPKLTGTIQSGVVLFSSPVITLPNSGRIELLPGSENAVNNPGYGAYMDLAGADITCDQITGTCGLLSVTRQVQAIGQAQLGPQAVTIAGPSGQLTLASPSHITADVPPGGMLSGDAINTADINPDGLSQLIGTMRITDLPPQYIGSQVLSGQLTVTAMSVTNDEGAYNFTSGTADVPAGTAITDSGTGTGQMTITLNFNSASLAGTVTARSGTVPVMPDNNVAGDTLVGTLRLRMVVNTLTFVGDEQFRADVATIVIRRMAFSDLERYDPSQNKWEIEAQNGLRIFGPTATLVPSGTVRIFGGRDIDVSGAPVANPFALSIIPRFPSRWTPVNAMDFPRGNHTTTLLPDGKMLIAGGSNGENVLPGATLFDPVTGGYAQIGGMTVPRDLHTATLMVNGTVLVAGGFTTNDVSTGATDTADIYFPNSRQFRRTTSMPFKTTNHTAILLADGNVLVMGGYRPAEGATPGAYLDSAAIYYATAAAWVSIPNGMVEPRALHRATLLQDGRVLITGGVNQNGVLGTAEIFDPAHDPHFYLAESLPNSSQLHSHAQVTLKDGRVLVHGGNDGFGETDSSFIYTPAPCANSLGACADDGSWTDTRSPGRQPNVKRFNHTATLMPNGLVAIVGGAQNLGNSLKSVEKFDVSFSSYQVGPDLATARSLHTTTVGPDGDLYVFGGFNGSSENSDMTASAERIHFAGTPDAATPGVSSRVRMSSITVVDVSPFTRGNAVTITGTKLLGIGEASGGGAGSGHSAHHNPGVTIQQVDGFMLDLTTRVYRAADPNLWHKVDGGSLTITMPSNNPGAGTKPSLGGDYLPFGWYQLRTFTNTIYADSFFAQAGPPKPTGTVTNINATGISESQIQWTWSPPSNPADYASFDHYRIYSGTSAVLLGQVPKEIGGVPITSFVQSGLQPNTTCVIFIAASNLSGDGPLAVSGTHYSLAAVPTAVTISSVSFNSLLLEWDQNMNTQGTIYEVSISEDDFALNFSTPVPRIAGNTGNSAAVAPLRENTVYYVRMRAFNGDGIPTAFTASVNTKTRAPLDQLAGVALSPTTIEWQWRDPGSVVNYKVYVSSSGQVIAQPTIPKFLDTGLSTNSLRSIRVSAVTLAGEGPLSDGPTVYTLAAPPALLASPLLNITTGSFSAAWGDNGNPPGTRYFLELLDGDGNRLSENVTTGFSGGIGGLPAAFPFSARVAASNEQEILSDFITLGANTTNARTPTNLQVTGRTPDSVSLSWSQNNNHTTTIYEVTYTTDTDITNNNEFKSIHTPLPFSQGFTGNTAVVTNLLTSSTYSFRVQGRTTLGVVTPFSATVTTSPSNGGVSRGSLGLAVERLRNSQVAGSVGPSPGRFVSMLVPTEAFTSDTFMTISTYPVSSLPAVCPGGRPIALSISVDPKLQPLKPLFFTFGYDDADLGGADPKKLTLLRVDGASGRCVPVKSTVDTANRRVTAELNHLSLFQVAEVSPASTADSTVVFPNPFYPSRGQGFVTFSAMPANSRVRVYTMRGELINDLTANAAGLLAWNGVNQSGRNVASGVYLAVVEGGGTKKIVKVVILR